MPLNGDKILGDLIAKQQKIIDQLTEIVRLQGQYNKSIAGAGSVKQLSTATQKLNDTTKKFNVQQNQLVRNEKLLIDAQKARAKQTDLETKAGKKLLLAQRKLSKERSDAIKKIDKQIGRQNRLTKSFQGAILKISAMYAGAKALIKGIASLIKISSDFEKQMDKVQSITNASTYEMMLLKKSAKNLGATTTKTASEVGQLQEELSKLGFSTSEILAGTGGILALSEATGGDLAQAAKVAGATIRGFSLDASESARVVDVMTKSFSSSALDLSKFETAMGTLAPVAKSANVSLEQSTAQLSALVDSGVDASTAGTSLRNIFLELSKQGITYDEALEKINTSTDKNATALELFGKRGATAALILADNTEKVARLNQEYINSEGTAKRMADTMKDNLAGDITTAKSAWEGLVLSFDDGSGTITVALRGIIKSVTFLLVQLRKLNKSNMDRTFEKAQMNVNNFLATLNELSDEEAVVKIGEKIDSLKETLEGINDTYEEFGRREKHYADIGIAAITNEIGILQESLMVKQDEIKANAIINEQEQGALLFKVDAYLKERELDKARALTKTELKEIEQELIDIAIDGEMKLIDAKIAADNAEVESKIAADKAKVESEIEKNIKLSKERQKAYDEYLKDLKEKVKFTTGFAAEVGGILGGAIANGEDALKQAGKQILLLTLKTIKGVLQQQVVASVAGATIQSFAQPDSVATFGATGVIRAAILVGLIEAAYAGVESLLEKAIPSYFDGGDHKGGVAILHGQEGIKTDNGIFKTNWGKYEGKLINLPESTVIPNDEMIQYDLNKTAQLGDNISLQGGISEVKFKEVMNETAKKIDKSIRNMPRDIYQGLTKQGVAEGNNITKYRDRRFRHAGR